MTMLRQLSWKNMCVVNTSKCSQMNKFVTSLFNSVVSPASPNSSVSTFRPQALSHMSKQLNQKVLLKLQEKAIHL